VLFDRSPARWCFLKDRGGWEKLVAARCTSYKERNLTFTAVQPLESLVNLVALVDAGTHRLSSSLADGVVLLSTWLRWISRREWTTLATLEVKQRQECSQQWVRDTRKMLVIRYEPAWYARVQRYDRLKPMAPCSTSHARVGLCEDDGKRSNSEGTSYKGKTEHPGAYIPTRFASLPTLS
jgi:hypothetical protein